MKSLLYRRSSTGPKFQILFVFLLLPEACNILERWKKMWSRLRWKAEGRPQSTYVRTSSHLLESIRRNNAACIAHRNTITTHTLSLTTFYISKEHRQTNDTLLEYQPVALNYHRDHKELRISVTLTVKFSDIFAHKRKKKLVLRVGTRTFTCSVKTRL